MTAGFREFEFDLPGELLRSLIQIFDSMDAAPLTSTSVEVIPEAQGVYQLLLGGIVVYVGKTDAEAGLRQRLKRHAWTIQNRKNLNSEEVSFKALRIFVFTAVDLETQLIHWYKSGNEVAASWNNSGFGSNDPGRNRDDTRAKPGSFDALYPVDLDRELVLEIESPTSSSAVLAEMKQVLPYTLRFEGDSKRPRRPHPELVASVLSLPTTQLSIRNLITAVVEALPSGWQATLLAGRIILYKEFKEYRYGEVISRSL